MSYALHKLVFDRFPECKRYLFPKFGECDLFYVQINVENGTLFRKGRSSRSQVFYRIAYNFRDRLLFSSNIK